MAGSGGHLPADAIGPFVRYQKETAPAPDHLLRPQVTNISLGHDHVSAAMGQILALLAGPTNLRRDAGGAPRHAGRGGDEAGLIVAALACQSADLARGKDRDGSRPFRCP